MWIIGPERDVQRWEYSLTRTGIFVFFTNVSSTLGTVSYRCYHLRKKKKNCSTKRKDKWVRMTGDVSLGRQDLSKTLRYVIPWFLLLLTTYTQTTSKFCLYSQHKLQIFLRLSMSLPLFSPSHQCLSGLQLIALNGSFWEHLCSPTPGLHIAAKLFKNKSHYVTPITQ